MTLGTDNVEPAGADHLVVSFLPRRARLPERLLGHTRLRQLVELRNDVAAKHDVGAPAGHVGRDRHRRGPSRLRDDCRFALVLLRVQHLVRYLGLAQHAGEQLRGLDGRRADQNRLLPRRAVPDVLQHRLELLLLREEDEIRHVVADHLEMGGYDDDLQTIDLLEFGRFGIRGPGHARELVVLPEVVLEGDRGERLVLVLDRHPFLRLDRLVQALRPAPARHRAPGELVDDDDLAVPHDVLDVAMKQRVRAQRRVEVMHEDDVGRIVETLAFGQDAGFDQDRLDLFVAVLGQMDLLCLLVDGVVARTVLLRLALEPGDDLVDPHVQLRALVRRTGNDERRAGLVDENRVDLVDDGKRQVALHLVGVAERHVVPKVVEAELVVGRVDHVGRVCVALVLRVHSGDDDAGAHAEKVVDRAHPLRVAPGKVVVHRDDVHAAAGERVQVGRKGGDERLALAGPHLGDMALVERDATDELDVEVTHLEGTPSRLAHDRECLGKERFHRLALSDPGAEDVGLRAKLGVGERSQACLQRIGAFDGLAHPAQLPIVASADDLTEQRLDHRASILAGSLRYSPFPSSLCEALLPIDNHVTFGMPPSMEDDSLHRSR